MAAPAPAPAPTATTTTKKEIVHHILDPYYNPYLPALQYLQPKPYVRPYYEPAYSTDYLNYDPYEDKPRRASRRSSRRKSSRKSSRTITPVTRMHIGHNWGEVHTTSVEDDIHCHFMDGARVFGAGLALAALTLFGITSLNTVRSRKRKAQYLSASKQ
jgi:hypothetical protein